MAKNITITLTDVEYKAMTLVAYDPKEWVEIFVKDRARKAIDQISQEIAEEKLENGEVVQGTKEDLIKNTDRPTVKEETDQLDQDGPPD